MKTLRFLLLTVSLLSVFEHAGAQSSTYKPKDEELYDIIKRMDGVMFDAFNKHDADALKPLFANTLEFYNDGGGVTDYNTTIRNFTRMFAGDATGGIIRELVEGSLEVYPVPNFGAIELGSHRFIHTENGKEEIGTMKFIHVWQHTDVWRVTRVISIGH